MVGGSWHASNFFHADCTLLLNWTKYFVLVDSEVWFSEQQCTLHLGYQLIWFVNKLKDVISKIVYLSNFEGSGIVYIQNKLNKDEQMFEGNKSF